MSRRRCNGRFLWWMLLPVLLLVWIPSARAQTSQLSLSEYWATLDGIQEALNNAGEDDRSVRETAVATLSAITAIELPDGRSQPIDHTFLIRQLQNETVSAATISTLLATYRSSSQVWPDPALPQLDRAALDDILGRPAFQYAPDEPNFFQRLWRDIRQAIEDFFLRIFPEDSGIRLPSLDLVVIVASILVAVVLAYALRGVIADFTADAALEAEEELGGETLTADLALKRAQELSTGGDYRTAVRYLYLSSLLLLEERGLLRYDRSLTNREYLRTVAHSPELAAILREVIDVFDRVWYGFQSLTAGEYEAYALRVETLKQQKEVR